MAKVFIAGHGRMMRSGSQAVPAGVNLHWAVPPRYNGSGGLSTAYLSGRYAVWAGHTGPGEPYYEHYLCPDLGAIMDRKAAAMVEGNWQPAGDHYLLQPRLKFTVTLSSILLFLKRKVPGPLDVYWTCCRSPINEPSHMVRLFEEGATRDAPAEGNLVADPGKAHSKPLISGQGVDVLLDKRDFLKKFTDNPVVVNGIEGGVTFKRLNDVGFATQGSWPGVAEDNKDGGRKRSGSFSTL
jgi:hypothetical protein